MVEKNSQRAVCKSHKGEPESQAKGKGISKASLSHITAAVQTSAAVKDSGDKEQVSRTVFGPLCSLQSPLAIVVVKAS